MATQNEFKNQLAKKKIKEIQTHQHKQKAQTLEQLQATT